MVYLRDYIVRMFVSCMVSVATLLHSSCDPLLFRLYFFCRVRGFGCYCNNHVNLFFGVSSSIYHVLRYLSHTWRLSL